MKRFILYLMLLFPEIIIAQQFNVKGYVIDNQAKDVLVGAYVLEKDTYT